jgi:hypothetical protein
MGSPVSGGTARDLLVMLTVTATVAVTGVVAMAFVAAGVVIDPSSLAVLGAVAIAAGIPGLARRRRTRYRRRLRQRVGDPAMVSGVWRRALAGAWSARDQYAAAVAEPASPLWERVAEHQSVVDAALERCGALARDGDRLTRQLQGFGARRMRRDLRVARWRDPKDPRTQVLATRVADVEQLERRIRTLEARLDAQVHDLRTAAWRVTELRTHDAVEPDDGLADLLADLAHLRAALEEVDTPSSQRRPDVDGAHDVADASASTAGRRYDV